MYLLILGVEIDDCMMIEDDDLLFFSSKDDFIQPKFETEESFHSHLINPTYKPPGIVGSYKVGDVLGRGGFGEVRIGTHQLTGEKVALKFMRKSEIQSIGAAERTATEIQCLTALQHPNIIRLQQVALYSLKIISYFKTHLHECLAH
jgi:serine/threonine protein kinase